MKKKKKNIYTVKKYIKRNKRRIKILYLNPLTSTILKIITNTTALGTNKAA